jgi:hypothetical protein
MSPQPSAAKAGVDFAVLTARLEAAPFQNKIKTGSFSANWKPRPFKTERGGIFSSVD